MAQNIDQMMEGLLVPPAITLPYKGHSGDVQMEKIYSHFNVRQHARL